jgi:hypothetical protein
MRIVEQECVSAASRAMPSNPLDKLGAVPFMNEDEISGVAHLVEVEGRRRVASALQVRVEPGEALERALAGIQEELCRARRIVGFIDAFVVTAHLQFRDDTAQKLRAAVIPVRQK